MVTDATFTNNFENYTFGGRYLRLGIASPEPPLNPTTGALPITIADIRANEVAMYIQDDWRIHPALDREHGRALGVFWPAA